MLVGFWLRYEEMVDALAAQATEARKTMDDGLKEGTKLGPINNKMQFARVRQRCGLY